MGDWNPIPFSRPDLFPKRCIAYARTHTFLLKLVASGYTCARFRRRNSSARALHCWRNSQCLLDVIFRIGDPSVSSFPFRPAPDSARILKSRRHFLFFLKRIGELAQGAIDEDPSIYTLRDVLPAGTFSCVVFMTSVRYIQPSREKENWVRWCWKCVYVVAAGARVGMNSRHQVERPTWPPSVFNVLISIDLWLLLLYGDGCCCCCWTLS